MTSTTELSRNLRSIGNELGRAISERGGGEDSGFILIVLTPNGKKANVNYLASVDKKTAASAMVGLVSNWDSGMAMPPFHERN